MNLKDFLSTRDKPPELYWSLVIEKGWVQAGIWYVGDSAAEVIAISAPAAWEVEAELVGACDAALSSAVAKLPENYDEPSKTVFGVVSSWVKGGEIQDTHLAKIKTVCTELSLSPVGFVVLPEAIAHLFKSEDGSPLSAVVVGLGAEDLEVSVFKMGNLLGTTTVARSVSLPEDMTEGLSRFEGATPLPSRIILYDGKDVELEEAKEELIGHDWDSSENSKFKFLHTPKVEILVSDRKVLATSLAGAAEIANIQKVENLETPGVSFGNTEVEETLPPKEEIENVTIPDDVTSAEELGFVMDEDITDLGKETTPPVVNTPTPAPTASHPHHHVEHNTQPVVHRPNYVQQTKKLFHSFSTKIKSHGSPQRSALPKPLMIIIVLVILFLGALSYLWFIPKAVVTVYVSPESYQEQFLVKFNAAGQYDAATAQLPGRIINGTAVGEKTKSTTGSKLVGEKATGSVQIANGNGNPIRIASGTILTSTSGLKFQTTAEASVSGQLIPGSPGTATLSVASVDIGAQYNLAKGEIFKVGTFDKSQVAATSQVDFSGGSSQQIAAVSADDQKKLEEELKQELMEQAMDDLSSKLAENEIFVNDLAGTEIASQIFDHKVGEIGDTLKLNLEVTVTGVAADKAKLLQYTSDQLKSKIPQGFALRSSQVTFKFSHVGKTKDDLTYNVDIGANFLPVVNTDELISKIAGKTTTVVTEYLSSVPGYTSADVKLNTNLPGPFSLLPRLKKNITIEVASDR